MSMAQAPIACAVTSPVSKVTTRNGPPRLFAPSTPMTAPCGSFAGPPVVWPRSSPTPSVPLPAPAVPLPLPAPVPVVPQTAVLRSAPGPVERPIDQAVERPSYRPVSRPAERENTAEDSGARNSTGLRPEQLLLHQLEKEVEKSMEPAGAWTQSFVPEKTATLPRPPPMLMKAAAARAKQDEDLQQSVFLGAGPGTGSSGFSDSQSSEATSAEPEAEDVTQARRRDRRQAVPPRSKSEENLYLRKNMENLRKQKRHLQQQVESIEARLRNVEAQKLQYQKLFEDSHRSYAIGGEGRDLEITGLHQQLAALLMLKDALNSENMELQTRIKGLEEEKSRRSPAAACVICMENLANVVCLPCKHLALCSFCSKHSYGERSTCPICRGSITDRMLIYMP